MGQEINRTRFSEADLGQFSARLTEETAALRAFAQAGGFGDARHVAGFELEAWLLDHAGRPNPVNEAYLRALSDPLVVPELSRFNVELNAGTDQLHLRRPDVMLEAATTLFQLRLQVSFDLAGRYYTPR
jgi:hypothetical protein